VVVLLVAFEVVLDLLVVGLLLVPYCFIHLTS
jgi:hypothetical protein